MITLTTASPEVNAIRHQEKRKNIPTEELRDFVAGDEAEPPKMLYPRDPSLDQQLGTETGTQLVGTETGTQDGNRDAAS